MRVYPAVATIRPRFGRKTLVFRSLRPETGLLENKTRPRADMKDPLTPLTTARSMVTARANPRHVEPEVPPRRRQDRHRPHRRWRRVQGRIPITPEEAGD